MQYTPSFKEKYSKNVVPALVYRLGYKNPMQVPRLEKISINQGLGAAVADKKIVDTALVEMSNITGQKAVATISKKAISNFKLRENMPNGVKVTLRGNNMYEFLERLVSVALPRV